VPPERGRAPQNRSVSEAMATRKQKLRAAEAPVGGNGPKAVKKAKPKKTSRGK
jgi:hypothetical protein